jgi:hypothetical protein
MTAWVKIRKALTVPRYRMDSIIVYCELPKRVLPGVKIRSEVNRSQSIVVVR